MQPCETTCSIVQGFRTLLGPNCTGVSDLAWSSSRILPNSNPNRFSETLILVGGNMGLSVGSVPRIYCIQNILEFLLFPGFILEIVYAIRGL